ncbi:condensation domain-containing protein, partial [Streptomyces chlorus]
GRVDDQVKVRGFRIELGEIEAVLDEHPDVHRAVVMAREDRPGTQRLVAYVVPAQGHNTPGPDLRGYVRTRLPDHMVPAAVVPLDALPLTTNGKVDRARLPAPDHEHDAGTRPARGPREALLCRLFAETLGVADIGIDDSFFALGGDSIMSIQLVGRARRSGSRFSVRTLFEHPTVAELARAAAWVDEDEGGENAAEAVRGVGVFPALPISRSLLERGGDWAAYHHAQVLRVPAGLTWPDLLVGVQAVLDRHDVLRSRVRHDQEQGPVMDVAAPGSPATDTVLSRVDVRGWDGSEVREETTARAAAAGDELDPATGIMLRLVWLDAGAQAPGVLVIVAHHMVVDGVSWRVLLPDLAEAVQHAGSGGAAAALAPVGTSLRAWSLELARQAVSERRESELDWWTSVLSRRTPVADGELDPERDRYSAMGLLSEVVPSDVSEIVLTRTADLYNAGVEDVLLTAFALALSRWRQAPDGSPSPGCVVELEGHGRHEELMSGADLSRTMGWFTTVYPVWLDPGRIRWSETGGPGVGEAIKRVKEQLRAVPDRGVGYGLLRHLNPGTADVLRQYPAPQVGFNYLGRMRTAAGEDHDWGLLPGAVHGTGPAVPLSHVVELNAVAEEQDGLIRLRANWSWAPRLLSEDDVRALARLWVSALTGIAEHTKDPDAGGITPTDFSLSTLSQSEIDLLEADWESFE